MPSTTSRCITQSKYGAPVRPRVHPSKWLLGMFGAGCSILGMLCLLLAACSTNPRKPEPQATPTLQSIPTITAPTPPATVAAPAPVVLSPWQRLREQFALADCDYGPGAETLAKRYARNASGFSNSLSRAMPFLLLVIDQIEQRGMPGEFALLPYVESTYVPTASGGSAAGIWQLMPATAKASGLRVETDFDARLDVPASTAVALDLLQRYHEKFADWRLADMAFNAGEYRVKKVLSGSAHKRSPAQVRQLDLSPVTQAHLTRLMALACIVANPQRYALKLPDPKSDDHLDVVDLHAPVDLDLAAHLAGMSTDRLQYLNSGYVLGQMPTQGPFRLLLPKAQRDVLITNLSKLPESIWPQWHVIVLRQPESMGILASAYAVEPQVLASANLLAVDAQLAIGTQVLLPGPGKTPSRSIHDPAAIASRTARHHVVRSGDTLSAIAQRAHLSLNDLCRWNGLDRHAILKPGRRLRLYATSVDAPIAAATLTDRD